MTIRITPFILGPLENNTYLIEDLQSKEACVIDPSFDPSEVVLTAKRSGIHIVMLLITHAHFDHIAGTKQLLSGLDPEPTIGINIEDLELWRHKGGADKFGISIDELPQPNLLLQDGDSCKVGDSTVSVIHTPGHSPGHLTFSIVESKALFCGDLIFAGGIGRTDFTGGNYNHLMESIQKKILTYPDNTKLYPGHGPSTTVGFEKSHNPFL
jgi:hydroxyacylglutathione hydrolase